MYSEGHKHVTDGKLIIDILLCIVVITTSCHSEALNMLVCFVLCKQCLQTAIPESSPSLWYKMLNILNCVPTAPIFIVSAFKGTLAVDSGLENVGNG